MYTLAMVKKADGGGSGGSQAVKAQLRLRELILSGELAAGSRIVEVSIVDRVGVSRTPIRAALMRLEQEGLLRALPGGGYAVREFSERDVGDAIELRGTLEGLVARLAAERGVAPERLAEAAACLAPIDALLRAPALDYAAFQRYADCNGRFHELLHAMADSELLESELRRVVRMPFASPSGFVLDRADSPQARDMLLVAQEQHRLVLDAITRREGARAEAILREHSRLAHRNLHAAMAAPHAQRLPGVQLIRSAA
jgi:GntR family transcriptional regulator of vanillate catabolism